MALYIKFDGIDGECNDKDHKAWTDLQSFSWAVSKAGEGATGQTRRRGVVTIHDINCTKEYDKSSPKLTEAICKGKVFPKLEIHDCATYGDARAPFMKFELKNVSLTNQAISAAGGGDAVPLESFSLNFEEVKQTYVEYDAKGSKKGNVEMNWKVEEGTT
jgi:type VI secretion system secreted protein Hcp